MTRSSVAPDTTDTRVPPEPDDFEMIQPEEAWKRIADVLEPLPAERVARSNATSRVLTESLSATVDIPALDVSAMDGFAISAESRPGQTVSVAGTVAAGDAPGAILEAETALRIMTGAPLPAGADRVIPVEQTEIVDNNEIRFLAGVPAAAHIRRQGEVLMTGMPLLAATTPLTPGAISLLATHGYGEVSVHRRPRVRLLSTGDEVVPPDEVPRPGQLRDSHTDFLMAAGRSLSLSFQPGGIAPDQIDGLRQKIKVGLDSDVLLVCGGVSMGEFDFVEEVLADLDCRVLFDSVAIQPGKPLVVARHSGGWVFGLPGNPASVMVGFWLFVRPVLRRLQGIPDAFWSGAMTGELADSLPGAKGRDRFFSAQVRFEDHRVLVTPQPARGSHDLAAFARGSALVRVAAQADPAIAGDRCQILPLADWPNW
jgi:molybdopterin molybdotransferase